MKIMSNINTILQSLLKDIDADKLQSAVGIITIRKLENLGLLSKHVYFFTLGDKSNSCSLLLLEDDSYLLTYIYEPVTQQPHFVRGSAYDIRSYLSNARCLRDMLLLLNLNLSDREKIAFFGS